MWAREDGISVQDANNRGEKRDSGRALQGGTSGFLKEDFHAVDLGDKSDDVFFN